MGKSNRKSVYTSIPTKLNEKEFVDFFFSHLSMPKRGAFCKIRYYKLFDKICSMRGNQKYRDAGRCQQFLVNAEMLCGSGSRPMRVSGESPTYSSVAGNSRITVSVHRELLP